MLGGRAASTKSREKKKAWAEEGIARDRKGVVRVRVLRSDWEFGWRLAEGRNGGRAASGREATASGGLQPQRPAMSVGERRGAPKAQNGLVERKEWFKTWREGERAEERGEVAREERVEGWKGRRVRGKLAMGVTVKVRAAGGGANEPGGAPRIYPR